MNKSFLYFVVGAVIPTLLIFGIWKWAMGGKMGLHFLPEKKHHEHNEKHRDSGDAEVLLTISGSNTLGEQLLPNIAKAFLAEKGAKDVQIERDDQEATVSGELNGKSVSINIIAKGSGSGFKDLGEEEADLVMASRQIKPEEAATLSKKGDMFSHSAEHILGLDGIAVVVNPANNLRSLTLKQVADIFRGRITNWSELPAARISDKIKIYVRDSKSGTYEVF
ncbi:MAG: substrate-binding domain-containing protein, partial [Bacteroidia bacterium]